MTKQKLPEFFYATIKVTMKKLLTCDPFSNEQEEMLDRAWKTVRKKGLEQIKRIKQRKRLCEFYGFDVGYNFELDYQYAWVDIDGAIQLLRMDMLPIGDRSLNAEMESFDTGMSVKWNDVTQEYDNRFKEDEVRQPITKLERGQILLVL